MKTSLFFNLPTRSLVFYFSISSSIMFLTFVIIWVNKTTPSNSVPAQEETGICLQLINTPPLGITVPVQTNLTGNLNSNITVTVDGPEDSILKLKGTPSGKPDENASGFSVNVLPRNKNESQVLAQHNEEDRRGRELDGNFSQVAQSAPAISFDKVEIKKEEQNAPLMNKTDEQNAAASGFSGTNSPIGGLQKKEDVFQVPEQQGLHQDNHNFTTEAQSAPAILFDKIEIRTAEDQSAPMNKTKEQNAASGFSRIKSPIQSQVPAQQYLHHDQEDRGGGELDGNFTTVEQSAPAVLIEKIEIRTEDQNVSASNKTEEKNAASVFSGINSITSELQRNDNQSQVAQHHEEDRGGGELDGNFTAVAHPAPAILIEKNEIRSGDQIGTASNKTEDQHSALNKKIDATSIKSMERKKKKKKKKKTRATSFDQTTQISSSGLQVEDNRTIKGSFDQKPQISSSGQQVEDKRTTKGGCDFSTRGRWVYDESYPLYTNRSCPFIFDGFDCQGNGRLDKEYMKWRWQPQDCDIPRFNATKMLELLRGKRLVFVGDSINRNQFESMVCMLIGDTRDPSRPRFKHEKGMYHFNFVDYKCTVEFSSSVFLVEKAMKRVGKKQVQTLRIDSIDHSSSQWRGAHILVFDTEHWWTDQKTNAGVNFYQEGDRIHPYLDVFTALRKGLMTWASWVDKNTNPRKTQVFFRASSPTHFSGGEWKSGRSCIGATQPLLQPSGIANEKDVIAEEVIKQMKTRATLLNITSLSEYRIDSHPSGIGDCSHWCLPGLPDVWNELLYVHLLST